MASKQVKKIYGWWQQLTSGSVNRQIFGAAAIVALGTLLVKVVTFAKESVVAWRFGTGDAVDAFFMTLTVSAFIINTVTGSVNAAVIPTYIQVREQEGKQVAQKLLSGTITWNLIILAIATIVTLVAAPLYLPSIASGFNADKIDLTFKLLCAIAPAILLSGLVTIWTNVLNAGERFALSAISPILTPLITILLLLFFPGWGIFALPAALVFGAILELTVLGKSLRLQEISLLPQWHGFDARMAQVTKQYLPIIASSFLMNSTVIVDQLVAATLPTGSISSLNYGNRITALPIVLLTTALSTAVIPYFSRMVASKDWAGISHTLRRYLLLIFAIAIPLTTCLYIFSEPLVQLVYQRGKFSHEDTILVAQVQAFLSLQIPFYIGNILINRMISALQGNLFLMFNAALNLIIDIILDITFSHWLGIAGIALASVFMYLSCFCVNSFSCWHLLRRKIQSESGSNY
ncbi:MAG: polysaccharide biosynthesis C-terminal domain-containing protein [Cyanosarcina radialis HA8281-LM2]|jgi:putative peptidoglycan lipid II flippase|nr:polysaccharide biosynthesis C-terminal domain-containing protein [Cyanosarcina radialis HA8281-LM2]